MGFGWPTAHLFLICPGEKGLLQFHSSAVLGIWVLFSLCGYLPHSGSGVLESWIVLVVVTCSTLRLNNVFRKLILVTFIYLFIYFCLPFGYFCWSTVHCLRNLSVRLPYNSLYGIHLTVIILRLLLPLTAFHSYWSISSVFECSMRDIKFSFNIFCTDVLCILFLMFFIYSLRYKVIYLYICLVFILRFQVFA